MAELMKDRLGRLAVEKIADKLQQVWPKFDRAGFIADGMDGLEKLELKARVNHLIEVLDRYLPDEFEQTADIFIAVSEVWDDDQNADISIFSIWPLIDYVGIYGLAAPEKALDVLQVLTPLFSAEFAIRPFINEHFELTYKRLNQWVRHENEHLRRLASEGMRPRLPWGLQLRQFIDDPTAVIELLETLKDDEALYVRKSVANNLNDISKDHAELVVKVCKNWLKKSTKNRKWIATHATRGLVKKGFPPVFGLLGYTEKLDVQIENLRVVKNTVKMGESLEFEFDLHSNGDQKFVIDYAIHFMKSNGKLAPKIFKLKNVELAKGQKIKINKKQMFKPISTRKYYAGEHKLEIFLNGCAYGAAIFQLEI